MRAGCALSLGHDGDCDGFPPIEMSPLGKLYAEGTARTFRCTSTGHVEMAAYWVQPGDTVEVPSGMTLPRGKMVPGVEYRVAS